jgi:hypothetical protein
MCIDIARATKRTLENDSASGSSSIERVRTAIERPGKPYSNSTQLSSMLFLPSYYFTNVYKLVCSEVCANAGNDSAVK